METVVGGLLLLALVLGFMPAVRGVAKGIESFEKPGKPETQEEHERANSDMARLVLLLLVVFGVLFAMKLGAL